MSNSYIVCLFLMISLLSCKDKDKTVVEASTVSREIEKLNFIDSISLDYVLGKFDPASHEDFSLIDSIYADRPGLYMRTEAYGAFKQMYGKAKTDGIHLVIRSAARNFDYQKGIWERKWDGTTKVEGQDLSQAISSPKERALKILEYSSMPGTSRHHWGTDIDLNNFENTWFESNEGLVLFSWMEANAKDFGFCRPYTSKGEARPDGYNEEKWHWSYTPLAIPLTQKARTALKDTMIKGFRGAETAEEIGVVNKYVLGINKECK